MVLIVGPNPIISNSSPLVTVPRSTRPVHTVPLPAIEKTSREKIKSEINSQVVDRFLLPSIGIKNGLSKSLVGVGIYVSTASMSFLTASTPRVI